LTVESAVRGSNHVGVSRRIKLEVVMGRLCYGVVCLEDVSNIFTVPVIGSSLNPLNAELNPICHLLALLGAHHILHVSRIRVNIKRTNIAVGCFVYGRFSVPVSCF
jgi:hypothetical protein